MKNPLVIHASCPRKLLFVSARSNYSRARKREENRGLRNQKIDDTEKRCAIRGDKIIVASKIRLTHAAPPTGLLIGHRFLVKQNIYRRACPLSSEISQEDEVWTKEFRGWTEVDEIQETGERGEDRFCSERAGGIFEEGFLRDEFLQQEEGIIQVR